MNEARIRIDLKKGGKVSITKSSIVAAVRLLEQDKSVSFPSSQEVANWTVDHLVANYVPLALGNKVMVQIKWVDGSSTSVSESRSNASEAEFTVQVHDNTIMSASVLGCEGMSVSDALPMLIARIIKKTPCVKVEEKDIDEFV